MKVGLVPLFVSCIGAIAAAPAAEVVPSAILRDPPADKTLPASGHAVQIPSHGEAMNAMVYLPAGQGPHPVVVLLHGFPGNEQNLDLAQAMRRAGWAVVTFHYRGSWGSAGMFTFDGAIADGAATLAWVRDPLIAQRLRFDTKRIVIAGHSWGGYVAAAACASDPNVLGCVLIAPWDVSADVALVKDKSAPERERLAGEQFDDVDGRLDGMTARQVVDFIAENGGRLRLTQFASGLAQHAMLLVLATHDADDDKALELLPALKATHTASLRVETLDTDHSFNDRRIALESSVLKWLAALPGAPK